MDIRTPVMSWRILSASALVVAALAGTAGYWFGTSRHGAFEVVGIAHSTAARIGVETENWSYNVPLDVRWTDANGEWHEGERPRCLPPSSDSLPGVRIAAVPVETRGLRFRQVVAVYCE